MLDYGPSEFFGIMIFLPVLVFFTFAIYDGFGIFRDVFNFKTREDGEAESIFHHHFHYKDPNR